MSVTLSDDEYTGLIGRVDDLEETVDNQGNKIENLETENTELREKSGLKEEIADELQSSNEVEVRSEGEQAGLSDIWIAGNPIGTLLDKALQNSSDAKKTAEQARATRSAEDNPKGNDGDTGSQSGDMLPIERLRQIREKDKDHPALPKNGRQSFDRALVIYEHFGEWSKKAPKGRTINSGLKTLLETVTGERLFWSQIKRACKMLEKYSKGSIILEKTSRHGNVLVAENQSVLAGGG